MFDADAADPGKRRPARERGRRIIGPRHQPRRHPLAHCLSHALVWKERIATRPWSGRAPATRHAAAAVARASAGSPWALTSTCTARSPGAPSSSSSSSIGVSFVGPRHGHAGGHPATRSTPFSCAQPRNVVPVASHGSCSRTSRPSAVRQTSVLRPSAGPASVACSAARDKSGPGSRPRRCVYNRAASPRPSGWLAARAQMSRLCYRPVVVS